MVKMCRGLMVILMYTLGIALAPIIYPIEYIYYCYAAAKCSAEEKEAFGIRVNGYWKRVLKRELYNLLVWKYWIKTGKLKEES